MRDRICPTCQVLIPDWAKMCVKCGKITEPPDTGLRFVDLPQRAYPGLAKYLGRTWGLIVAIIAGLLLLAIFIAGLVMRMNPVP